MKTKLTDLLKPEQETKVAKRTKTMKKPAKVSRAKASSIGNMLGKALAARAAGAGAAGPSPMGRVPMGAPATPPMGMKKGGSAKKMAGGGVAQKGKTRGKIC